MGTTMAAEFWGTVSSRAYRYMGHGCHPVRTSRREYVSHVSTVRMFLTLCSDTPWDEPTERSPEFCRYLSGEIFNEEPWTNFSTNALCTLTLRLLWRRPNLLYSSDLWHVDPGIREAHDHVRNLCTSLVCKVSRNSDGKLSLTPIRPSQLATRGVHALAEQLSQSLRENGDLMYANPDISGARSVYSSLQLALVDLTCLASSRKDADGDEIMSSAQSQFTQSLLLFVSLPMHPASLPTVSSPTRRQSQTQSGRRYTPQLTRFYTAIGPGILVDLIKESLDALEVKHKDAPVIAGSRAVHRLRVGGYDKRKIMFKGWIELEVFSRMQVSGAFCVMQRDVVRRRARAWSRVLR